MFANLALPLGLLAASLSHLGGRYGRPAAASAAAAAAATAAGADED